MRDAIRSFYSADRRHHYTRFGWQDGRVVWKMWASWSKGAGHIDWVPVKTMVLPKSLSRAEIIERMKEVK